MAKFRVGEQIAITEFVRKGVDFAGREGFVESVERFKKYTVLLYRTNTQRECTVDVKEHNLRKN